MISRVETQEQPENGWQGMAGDCSRYPHFGLCLVWGLTSSLFLNPKFELFLLFLHFLAFLASKPAHKAASEN
jgi:hypothetical protein